MTSPYKSAPDSPSRQLLYELQQLSIRSQEKFYAHLDRENDEREALHKKALATASAKHEHVRKVAEIERQRLEEEKENERRREEDESRRVLERQRSEHRLERQRREAEQARASELEEQRIAESKRRAREASEKRKAEIAREDAEHAKQLLQKERDEREQIDQAKAREAHAGETATSAQRAPAAFITDSLTSAQEQQGVPTASQRSTTSAQAEGVHRRYLEIHRQLKSLRAFMVSSAKEHAELKTVMGDMRREIKKSVGQLTEGKGANKQPLSSLLRTLRKAMSLTEPTVDITLFLATPPSHSDNPNGPALLVYLLNIFAKAIISQFINEAGVSPKSADPIGMIASHIFAVADFRWQGLTLIDILLAKFHVTCPPLFGIHGSEITSEGKRRLGWWLEEPGGPFVPVQRHNERMTGLGAGFAAISLRNYEKARAENPFPDYRYWEALAAISNVPPQEITQTHFVILKAMIEGYETKFISFFGAAAVAALRRALIDLPRAGPPSVAAKSLAGLADVLRMEKKLAL